ncbi:hypothetical protein [Kitasatospora cheerisanensis]|uniref:Uncharacterized protein n=1 Tax=Kitasatospora cheerisanensis KCTC 2395 TaxID=1348663 RepID=A0A066YHF2_9ACTN|nr:hypothetical protein [Kitasatospora cheerisanensis]KDN80567.1 hypothetical protein KCH_77140 [Kitasatospora cheerisanensis KCTC 2395]
MPQEQQLVSGAAGRVTLDGYSWRQAAHWVHGAGLYVATHGPRFGETTLRLVEVLAELTPCRPTIAYLMRRLGCSRRTVQYHLGILRSTGLLAWRSIGTRLPMTEGQKRVESLASEYERLIPVSYDQALGIRTAGEGLERRMVGISEEGRTIIAELGKKAATKPRRVCRTVRHKSIGRPVKNPRCTPMVGGTTHYLSSPSVGDQKTTGGARVEKSATRKKRPARPTGERRRTVLGQVVTAAMMAAGDRMAQVAYRRVPWVRRASHDQLRWVLNDIADRGWGPERAVAWLAEIAGQYGAGALWRPERPHALIAHALRQETEQDAYDQQLRQDVAARVEPMDNAAMRELAGLAGLFALMDTPGPNPESGPAEETLAQAHWAPRTVVAAIDDDVDAAIDRYGIDLVARYAGLAANPNVQIGVR